MIQKEIEKKSLIISSVVNLIMAGAGIWVYLATSIQALYLDGVFSLIGFISAIAAVIISKRSRIKTQTYPDGHYFLEPLYAILKSLLTIILMVVSVIGTATVAYDYFAHGKGEVMVTEPVMPYTICMVILCFGISFFNKYQNKKINNTSTILTAESKSNFVDGILSLGVGVAIIFLRFIDVNGTLGFLHYTGDFFVTFILVAVSMKAPIVVIIESFVELSNGSTKDMKIHNVITKVVYTHLNGVTQNIKCDIFKVGMHIEVRVYLRGQIKQDMIEQLENARQEITDELKKMYDSFELNYSF